jgi:hypothetical protein
MNDQASMLNVRAICRAVSERLQPAGAVRAHDGARRQLGGPPPQRQ